MTKTRSHLVGLLIKIGASILFMGLSIAVTIEVLVKTNPVVRADSNRFVDLIGRAHDHNADVIVTLKYQRGGTASASKINEVGADFFCVVSPSSGGWSDCFPYEAVAQIDVGPYADTR